MLKALKNRDGVKPKGGFRGWTYPSDKYPYVFNDEYQSITDLWRHVRSFEEVNELEPYPFLADVLEDYFCRTCGYYGQFCVEEPVSIPIKDKVSRVIAGGKAVARIKVKSARGLLKVLPADEVAKNVAACVGCDQNRYASETQHEGMYKHDVEKAYGVADISEVETEKHSELGRCEACGCSMKTKVFLHGENYGQALIDNIHDMNRMLKARTGNGEVCPQLERTLLPQHLQEALDNRVITHKNLKTWGYKK